MSVRAVRDGLDPGQSIGVRLKAAEKYLKAHGKMDGLGSEMDTAEDVVKRILELKITETRPVREDHRVGEN